MDKLLSHTSSTGTPHDLRGKSPYFYSAASSLASATLKYAGKPRGESSRLARQASLSGASSLRSSLVKLFGGHRLVQTIDWAVNSQDEDVSSYTRNLPDYERRLFDVGRTAAMLCKQDKMGDNKSSKRSKVRRLQAFQADAAGEGGAAAAAAGKSKEGRIVSPEADEADDRNKRQRVASAR